MVIKKDSNAEYHSSTAISASGLKTIAKQSVKYFLEYKFKTTSAMKLGTAVHSLIYEGKDAFEKEFYPEPVDGRTKKGKEIAASGLLTLNNDEFNSLKAIEESFKNHELAQKYLQGEVEVSHYTELNGVPVRVRPDCKGDTWISDIKTTQDNSPSGFSKDVRFWKYHLQAVFYCDVLGYDPANFRFITVRTKSPFNIAVYGLSQEQIEIGRLEYVQALEDWKFYLNTGIALDYKTKNIAKDGALII